jgi:choline dehydrogenase-like flavoprotein
MINVNNKIFEFFGSSPTTDDCKQIYDICVIGCGASGAIAVAEFVKVGLKVVVLEQGPFVTPEISYDDILRSSEPAYVRQINGCWGLTGYPWTTCNVGGGTVFYGGASFRYREIDFDVTNYLNDTDIPITWPYSYTELAPYYDEVETILGVAGCPEKDPTSPHIQTNVSLSPVETSFEGELISKAATELELHPFPTPLAIATEAYQGRPQCNKESQCIEHLCLNGSKGDAYTVFLKPLENNRNFSLYAGVKAIKLLRKTRNKIDSVFCKRIDSGEEFIFKARYFVVACNAIQSAALLLRSTDEFSPSGIGNEYDMVGRGLCFKLSEYVVGYLQQDKQLSTRQNKLNNNYRQGGPFSTVSITDYYISPDCPTGLGGLIYESKYGFPYSLSSGESILRLECLMADQPAYRNRVHLSSEKDAWGVPRIVLDYQAHPRDMIRLEYMVERSEEILRKAGCKWIKREASGWEQGSGHLHGTCRGGHDPHNSVVDPNSRVHTVENLYVIDGSFMPYPGSVNPTLTIQANALRAARKLINLIGDI